MLVVRVELARAWEEHRGYADGQRDVTVKAVCANCNNGWMSSLEVQVAPYLAALWSGPCVLDRVGLTVIKRWAIKTAIMYELTHPHSAVADPALRRALRAGDEMPQTLVMLGARPPCGDLLELTHLGLALHPPGAHAEQPALAAHNYAKVTLAIGPVVLIVLLVHGDDVGHAMLSAGASGYHDVASPVDELDGRRWPLPMMTCEQYGEVTAGFSLL